MRVEANEGGSSSGICASELCELRYQKAARIQQLGESANAVPEVRAEVAGEVTGPF
jgi:hypothetical protein